MISKWILLVCPFLSLACLPKIEDTDVDSKTYNNESTPLDDPSLDNTAPDIRDCRTYAAIKISINRDPHFINESLDVSVTHILDQKEAMIRGPMGWNHSPLTLVADVRKPGHYLIEIRNKGLKDMREIVTLEGEPCNLKPIRLVFDTEPATDMPPTEKKAIDRPASE